MIISTMDLQEAAIQDYRGDFTDRLVRDDPSITYEEFVVYYMCRYASGLGRIDPDSVFEYHKKVGKIDGDWLKTAASKTHKMEIVHKWDEMFPKYKEMLADEAKNSR